MTDNSESGGTVFELRVELTPVISTCTDINTYRSINGFGPCAFAGLGPLGTDRR